jgi:hypothetical protein
MRGSSGRSRGHFTPIGDALTRKRLGGTIGFMLNL